MLGGSGQLGHCCCSCWLPVPELKLLLLLAKVFAWEKDAQAWHRAGCRRGAPAATGGLANDASKLVADICNRKRRCNPGACLETGVEGWGAGMRKMPHEGGAQKR